MANQTREDLIAQLVKKAQDEPEFRQYLLANPKKVLEAKLGVTLPESFSVKVHEESGDTLHIVLPAENKEELSNAELDLVAGGACWENCDCYP